MDIHALGLKKRGMSLVEAIIALTVMALVTTLVANLLPSLGFTIKRSENRYQADTLAVSILSHQAARPFDDLTPTPYTPYSTQKWDGTSFDSEIEIFEVPGTDAENVMGLRVRIRWEERGGRREVVHERWVPNIPK